jgi:protein NrfC
MKEKKIKQETAEQKKISRRDFMNIAGVFVVGSTAGGLLSCFEPLPGTPTPTSSKGYILVDSKKCQGCITCMLACSLAHEGFVNPSLSRIQIVQNPFACWPDDISVEQCRQCEDAKCVDACPAGALFIDKQNGNVRRVETRDCMACNRCVQACPYQPKNPILAPDPEYGGEIKSRKCDLCIDTPFHSDPAGGGVNGKQVCVQVCPVGAIKFTSEIPCQTDDTGYDVNLRDLKWGALGYPIL